MRCGRGRARAWRASRPTSPPPTGAQVVFDALPDVDILVNNLGIFAPTPVLEIDDDTWQRFWDVNVMSAIRLTRHYLPGHDASAAGGACSSWRATPRS